MFSPSYATKHNEADRGTLLAAKLTPVEWDFVKKKKKTGGRVSSADRRDFL